MAKWKRDSASGRRAHRCSYLPEVLLFGLVLLLVPVGSLLVEPQTVARVLIRRKLPYFASREFGKTDQAACVEALPPALGELSSP
jgi:hypothetical protein